MKVYTFFTVVGILLIGISICELYIIIIKNLPFYWPFNVILHACKFITLLQYWALIKLLYYLL